MKVCLFDCFPLLGSSRLQNFPTLGILGDANVRFRPKADIADVDNLIRNLSGYGFQWELSGFCISCVNVVLSC